MRIETIKMGGHVTSREVIDKLSPVSWRMRRTGDPVSIVFDLSEMTGYDTEAVTAFIVWHERTGYLEKKLTVAAR